MIYEQNTLNPAGFWIRLGANLLDGLIVALPIAVLAFLLAGEVRGSYIYYAIYILYSIIVPSVWHGYNVGKRIVGIHIAKVNGDKVGIGTMILRTLIASIIYTVTLGLGLVVSAVMVASRQDKRSIHDFLAGTYVTKERLALEADPYQPQV
ncbi:MAG: RDD family protein [Desulfitobacteriaceae bacterium]